MFSRRIYSKIFNSILNGATRTQETALQPIFYIAPLHPGRFFKTKITIQLNIHNSPHYFGSLDGT